jgi:hypothetical protein
LKVFVPFAISRPAQTDVILARTGTAKTETGFSH